MSLFAYVAVDARGRRRSGEVEADSERAARQRLKAGGLVPRRLEPVEHRPEGETAARSGRLGGEETSLLLQQLASLVGAGMPLAEALGTIAEGMESRRGQRTVASIRQRVLEGGSLAEAMRAQGLDDIVCNMVEAGEETGQLEEVAVRLAELLEHRQQLRQELLSATLYPAIILGFGVLVMLFLLAVVVPQVASVFEHTGGELPVLTRAMIAASEFLRDYGLALPLLLGALYLAYRLALRRPALREGRDRWLLRLPVLGPLLAKVETARLAHTLGMLLAGGVPVLAAMHIALQGVALVPLRRAVDSAREALREGGSLAESLRPHGVVPMLALRLIAVGERSGELDRMLLRVAKSYESEASRGLKRFVTVLEPMLVLLMAVAVGALALAILLPIVEMNELVR